MIAQETFTLAKRVAIPTLGLGTWLVDDGAVADLVVVAHLDLLSSSGQDGDLNRCGGWLGAMAQSDDDDA